MAVGVTLRARTGLVLLTLAVLFTLAGPVSGPAHAAARCPGHKVDTLRFSTGSVRSTAAAASCAL